jgi:ABC-2 type transport system permease protein
MAIMSIMVGSIFFAVVATSAKIGAVLPWQIPVNQLATDPLRVQFTLALGCIGGCAVFAAMLWRLSRREVLG